MLQMLTKNKTSNEWNEQATRRQQTVYLSTCTVGHKTARSVGEKVGIEFTAVGDTYVPSPGAALSGQTGADFHVGDFAESGRMTT